MRASANAFLGRRERAFALIERSLAQPTVSGSTLYNCACGYARLGETRQGPGLLERWVETGTGSAGWVRADRDLDSLRDPRFHTLVADLEHARLPEQRRRSRPKAQASGSRRISTEARSQPHSAPAGLPARMLNAAILSLSRAKWRHILKGSARPAFGKFPSTLAVTTVFPSRQSTSVISRLTCACRYIVDRSTL